MADNTSRHRRVERLRRRPRRGFVTLAAGFAMFFAAVGPTVAVAAPVSSSPISPETPEGSTLESVWQVRSIPIGTESSTVAGLTFDRDRGVLVFTATGQDSSLTIAGVDLYEDPIAPIPMGDATATVAAVAYDNADGSLVLLDATSGDLLSVGATTARERAVTPNTSRLSERFDPTGATAMTSDPNSGDFYFLFGKTRSVLRLPGSNSTDRTDSPVTSITLADRARHAVFDSLQLGGRLSLSQRIVRSAVHL